MIQAPLIGLRDLAVVRRFVELQPSAIGSSMRECGVVKICRSARTSSIRKDLKTVDAIERVEIACDVDLGLPGSKRWSETLGQRARASDKDEGKKKKEIGSFHSQMLGKANSPVRLPGLTGEAVLPGSGARAR
jgi:hypothetical protein